MLAVDDSVLLEEDGLERWSECTEEYRAEHPKRARLLVASIHTSNKTPILEEDKSFGPAARW